MSTQSTAGDLPAGRLSRRDKKALVQRYEALTEAIPALEARYAALVELDNIHGEVSELRDKAVKLKKLLEPMVNLHNGAQEHRRLRDETASLAAELTERRKQLVETDDTRLLQEVGFYEFRHPLADAEAYKGRLASLKDQIKSTQRDGRAISAVSSWTVNGSDREGKKMVSDISKLMLRAYNAEADAALRAMKPYKLDAAIKRLETVKTTISKLGVTMQIEVTSHYHRLRIKELELTSDYLAAAAEEKERIREERARIKEEEQAQKELEAAKAKLQKEAAHRRKVLETLRADANVDPEELARAEAAAAEVEEALTSVETRAANTRAGYVYVISNIGAFGEGVVKIGMTRRVDPDDRVRELGDASVPFRFDTHAMIFSEDAVALEQSLHRDLEHRRVNLVNLRREFFYATPVEVEALLAQYEANLLEFVEDPEALEWHQSENARAQLRT